MINEAILVITTLLTLTFILILSRFGKGGLFTGIIVNLILVSTLGAQLVSYFGFTTNAGNVFYASIFLAINILIEYFGKATARRATVTSVVALVVFISIIQFTLLLENSAHTLQLSTTLRQVFTTTPRIALASIIAYIAAAWVSISIYAYFKNLHKLRFMWLRHMISAIAGQLVDSVIFFNIAFFGQISNPLLIEILWTGYIVKIGVSVVAVPYLYAAGILADKFKHENENLEELVKERTRDLLKFRQAVDSATDGVLITGIDGKIIYVNHAWEELSGYTFGEVSGQNPRFLKSSKTPKTVLDTLWKSISGGSIFKTEEVVNRRKDGTEYAAQLHIFPVRDNDKTLFYVEISQDISKRKEIDQAKTDFISMVSHQMLTPLVLIEGYVSLLQSGKGGRVDAAAGKSLAEIFSGAKRMERLVKAFLTSSRIERGVISIEKQNFDLGQLVLGCCQDFMQKSTDKKLKLNLPVSGSPVLVYADPNQTHEVLINVLDNAIKFTERGTISVTFGKQGSEAFVTVKDTGIGLPEKDLPHIFEKLYWSKNWVGGQSESTGLGLYIAKLLIEQMGGIIKVESQVGKGSSFTFTLPLAKGVHDTN